MTQPKILNGKWLAKGIQQCISVQVERLAREIGRPPGLGVLLVGENPASQAYVRRKEKVAAQCGIAAFDVRLPATASQSEVAGAILEFNENPEVDGILLQLPLPDGLDEKPLLDSILPQKDVDGLHPLNQGLLLRGDGVLRPCTPSGAMKLIDLAYSDIAPGEDPDRVSAILPADLSGKQAVVIGRSILVGKAVAFLLLERNATVLLAHSRTADLASLVQSADIVVAAVGVPHLVEGSWIREGAVVIDVGINRLEDGSLTGDVDYESALPRCSAITPVPGGVGQMTVAMLMQNTLTAYQQANKDH